MVYGLRQEQVNLLFRVVYITTDWGEKVMNDALWRSAHWIRELHIQKPAIPWYHEGEPQVNQKGYPIKQFLIPLDATPPIQDIIDLGNEICQFVNGEPGNNTRLFVDPQNFLVFPHKVTWQWVTDIATCNKRIIDACGNPDGPAWWDRNHRHVTCCYEQGTMSLSLARMFFAPNNMVTGFFPEPQALLQKEGEIPANQAPPANQEQPANQERQATNQQEQQEQNVPDQHVERDQADNHDEVPSSSGDDNDDDNDNK